MNVELKLFENICINELSKPDVLNIKNFNINNIPSDYVISRDTNGTIISKYSDRTWNFSPYVTLGARYSNLYFEKINDNLLENEAKQLMLLLLLFASGKNASSYSVTTIINYYTSVIVQIALFAKQKQITIKTILEENSILTEYILTKCTSHAKIKTLSSLLKLLVNLDNKLSNINFKEDINIFNIIREKDMEFRKREIQTLIIPSRIFHVSLKARWEHINILEKHINNLSKFLKEYLMHSNFAIGNKCKVKTINSNTTTWDNAIKKYKLEDLFKRYNVTNRKPFNLFMGEIQGTCKHLIHAYSGMRNGEVLSLKNNCIEISKDNYNAIKLVGITTKLEGREKTTKWITSKEITRVINLLLKINTTIADVYNLKLEILPLFPSIGINNKTKQNISSSYYPTRRDFTELSLPKNNILLSAKDKKEIEEIDYMGTMDDLEIGQPWIFKSHQYRRSLAVYSILSGLVTLGALQIQLKHLFREMTLYYANGASYAKQLFDVSNNHIAHEIDKLKPELDTLMYIKNVIFSDEELFGTHGILVKKNVNNKQQKFQTYLLENREKTIRQFKNGEIAYKETALGGCISLEACDYMLTRSIIACTGCDSSIIKKSKLDTVINEQKEFIQLLNKNSIEYRTEVRDLKELEKQRKILLGGKA